MSPDARDAIAGLRADAERADAEGDDGRLEDAVNGCAVIFRAMLAGDDATGAAELFLWLRKKMSDNVMDVEMGLLDEATERLAARGDKVFAEAFLRVAEAAEKGHANLFLLRFAGARGGGFDGGRWWADGVAAAAEAAGGAALDWRMALVRMGGGDGNAAEAEKMLAVVAGKAGADALEDMLLSGVAGEGEIFGEPGAGAGVAAETAAEWLSRRRGGLSAETMVLLAEQMRCGGMSAAELGVAIEADVLGRVTQAGEEGRRKPAL